MRYDRLFVRTDWETQRREIAKYVLLAMTALFEGWTEELLNAFPLSENQRSSKAKKLQFPASPTETGAKGVVADLLTQTSPTLAGFPVWPCRRPRRDNPLAEKYAWPELDALLTVLRYFKEVRNAISHSNGRASARTVEAYRHAAALDPNALQTSFSDSRNPAGHAGRSGRGDPRGRGAVLRIVNRSSPSMPSFRARRQVNKSFSRAGRRDIQSLASSASFRKAT